MNEAELIASWEREEQAPFAGWDFSYLDGRKREERAPPNYIRRAAALLRGARSALDLDTGEGERLLELREHWPPRVAATEGYALNLRLAAERLGPLGVHVAHVESSERALLPFGDTSCDVVLNRHGGCVPTREIAPVLTPGGMFLTQQVHGQTLLDLLTLFGSTPRLQRGGSWNDHARHR